MNKQIYKWVSQSVSQLTNKHLKTEDEGDPTKVLGYDSLKD